MKVHLEWKKENAAWLAVMMIFAFVLFFKTSFSGWILAGFCAVYFFLKSVVIEFQKKWIGKICEILLLAAGSTLSAYMVQYLLLEEELRVKITDEKMFLNVLCSLAVYLIMQTFLGSIGLTCMIAHSFLMVFAGINYFVYLFRGNEFIFSDLRSIATGLSVAVTYEFLIEKRAACVILISVLYVVLAWKFYDGRRKNVRMSVLSFSLAVFLCIFIAEETQSTVTETWEQKGSYRNGYLLNFALSVRDSFVAAPDGYSKEAVAALEHIYADSPQEMGDLGKRPAIIVVMSESYSDLSVVGNFFTNEQITPYYDSLTENTLKGYALSSVFGAKTPNSEWEFLTGNSMAFLPSGSVVYQQYISDTPTSLVSNLKNIGYTCIAVHPYYETGWSRNTVYPSMGFDEMYFLQEFDETRILRKYITDQQLYEQIIECYENRKANEDFFLMSISMQNHGGYTEKYDNFTEQIRILGAGYEDANQYVSLLHESDKALEYLIDYFQTVKEPVEIVFFGDHLPSLNTNFFKMLNGKGLSGLSEDELENLYTVPFFIWTNYDTPEEQLPITSLNYLSTLALKRAGIELFPYNQFLADMMQKIPAINARGYYSLSKEKYLHLEDAVGEEAEWIRQYEILQYNNLFDKKNQSSVFFPYLDETD